MLRVHFVGSSLALAIYGIILIQNIVGGGGDGGGIRQLQRLTLGPHDHRVFHVTIPGTIPMLPQSQKKHPKQRSTDAGAAATGGSRAGSDSKPSEEWGGEIAVLLHVFVTRGRARESIRGYFFAEHTDIGNHSRCSQGEQGRGRRWRASPMRSGGRLDVMERSERAGTPGVCCHTCGISPDCKGPSKIPFMGITVAASTSGTHPLNFPQLLGPTP